jgi:hypothetical protein
MKLPEIALDLDVLASASSAGLQIAGISPPTTPITCPHCGTVAMKMQGLGSQRGDTVAIVNPLGAASQQQDVAPQPWTLAVVFLCGMGHRSAWIVRQDGEIVRQSMQKIDF